MGGWSPRRSFARSMIGFPLKLVHASPAGSVDSGPGTGRQDIRQFLPLPIVQQLPGWKENAEIGAAIRDRESRARGRTVAEDGQGETVYRAVTGRYWPTATSGPSGRKGDAQCGMSHTAIPDRPAAAGLRDRRSARSAALSTSEKHGTGFRQGMLIATGPAENRAAQNPRSDRRFAWLKRFPYMVQDEHRVHSIVPPA